MNVFGNWSQTDVILHNQRVEAARKRSPAGDTVPTQPPATSSPEAVASPLSESDLHDKVESHCRQMGYYYVHSRMDRRSTIQVGAPDFCIALPAGKMLWLELKRKGGKATPQQLATIAHLRKLGHLAAVVDNWEDAELLLR